MQEYAKKLGLSVIFERGSLLKQILVISSNIESISPSQPDFLLFQKSSVSGLSGVKNINLYTDLLRPSA